MSIIKANRWESTGGVLRSTILQTVTVNVNQNFTYVGKDTGVVGSTNNGDGDAGVDISPLSITITPTLASSRIIVVYYTVFGLAGAVYGTVRVKRGISPSSPSLPGSSSWMNQLNTAGSQWNRGTIPLTSKLDSHMLNIHTFQIIDNPNTTSAVTYLPNVLLEADSGSTTFYLNRCHYPNNDYGTTTGISTVTAMEIAQ
jgi:hypothetical protein